MKIPEQCTKFVQINMKTPDINVAVLSLYTLFLCFHCCFEQVNATWEALHQQPTSAFQYLFKCKNKRKNKNSILKYGMLCFVCSKVDNTLYCSLYRKTIPSIIKCEQFSDSPFPLLR